MTLHVRVRHAIGRLAIDASIDAGDGLTALLGPSGAGKTTVLNIIAGLIRPDDGVVQLSGEVLVDTARGVFTPPHDRRIGYVFQESRLFPHLTVRQNLTYGHWWPSRRGQDGRQLDDVVSLFGLAPLLARRPSRLSGGERQRVALGRALVSNPRLLLLDEPLGSVDVQKRSEILPYLDRLMQETKVPIVYVTHDRREIDGRAGQIVEMSGGNIDQSGIGQSAI